MDLTHIDTERGNPNTMEIDRQSTLGMLKLMNDEDARVAAAVRRVRVAKPARAHRVVIDRASASQAFSGPDQPS